MNAQRVATPAWRNKSLVTNLVAAACIVVGLLLPAPVRRPLLNIGLFALSGAITNWLAIYMLFERVPGLYGSGVIPARFEDFKRGIHQLIMEQFFTRENLERFLEQATTESSGPAIDLQPLIEAVDLSPAFEALLAAVMASSFGNMLQMFGGPAALEPLRRPFLAKLKAAFNDIAHSASFQEALRTRLSASSTEDDILVKIDDIVQKRLDELTPQMVKDMIQRMIREHLGWLVIWGGVFGGLIGLVTAWMPW
jgi:uncharacterized membrane protein YheB (UPF0754 family)